MPSLIFDLNVEMEDGSTFTVRADQRDVMRWEDQPFGFPAAQIEERMSMKMFRFLAWSTMHRNKETTLSWGQFNGQCVEAYPVDDEESAAPADAGDPSSPGQ